MPVSEISLKNLRTIPPELRHVKKAGEITHEKRLRIAERIVRKLDPTKKPLDVHYIEKAYEKEKVLIDVMGRLYPKAISEQQEEAKEFNKIEVYIEFGASNIQDKAQRTDGQGDCIDIEASSMLTQ